MAEHEYVIRNLRSEAELEGAFRLRHRVFSEEKGWLPGCGAGIETDAYDRLSAHLGVYDPGGALAAYLRLLRRPVQFMMEREFKFLSCREGLRRSADSAEVSRFCVCPEARSAPHDGPDVSMLLLKGLHAWSEMNGVEFLYAVTGMNIYRLYRSKGFPFRLICGPRRMEDDSAVCAVVMSWADFRTANSGDSLFEGWFTRGL